MSWLSDDDRAQILAGLTEAQLADFAYDWLVWARDEQKPPDGAWRTWLVMAGRGFGKTRTGAEWTRASVRDFRYVNIIGATADDARDIMVEGESGLLAICPTHERPTYLPSKRRLDWPNGAVSLIFTADEPERLRGKQHMRLWCLIGETLVLMADGTEKPIRDVATGEYVHTRYGPRRVIGSALTKRNAEIFRLSIMGRQGILGTADHPVWVDGRGFLPLGSLTAGMRVCVTSALSGAGEPGTAIEAGTTSPSCGSTEKSGKRPMDLFPMGVTSTTSTETRATIAWKTWNSSRTASTAAITTKPIWGRIAPEPLSMRGERRTGFVTSAWNAIWSALTVALSTIAALPIRRAIAPLLVSRPHGQAPLWARSGSAWSVATPTVLRDERNAIAQSPATVAPLPSEPTNALGATLPVLSAGSSLSASAAMPGSAHGHAPWLSMATIASVEKCATRADVYDIAVEGAREFFANGVLVHNCDEVAAWRYAESWTQAMLGLRLGRDPRVVATTTPRPTPLIRDLLADPATAVTHGSTYDNYANLAPAFLDTIIRRYEGTRLGRQELDAELLTDVEGALWTLTMLDAVRVREAPDLARIVVAIDPAVTSGEDADSTGIVVAGKGADGDGYVLADLTCRLSPDGWARRAVNAYEHHQADRIVAEVNNGGDLVETVLRTVAPRVSYKKVHASRGKRTRAEPIAALYEQGRVHHVGALPQLEDQMAAFVPDHFDGSPDRVDALVWALTELMLNAKKTVPVF